MSTSDVPRSHDRRSLVDRLNEDCFCIEIDKARLADEFASRSGDGSANEVSPNLFSTVPVFVERSDYDAMVAVVAAVEHAVGSESYRTRVLSWAPEIARHDFGPIGVFTGYDFHLTPEGPRLIEINTNAGGAFLCALVATSQSPCCPEVEPAIARPSLPEFEAAVMAMFEREWRRQRPTATLRSIAIVDDTPLEQPLLAEFKLARALFEHHGIESRIVDPRDLLHHEGKLTVDGRPIDLVYNRLVDFDLGRPEHRSLRAAYLAGDVVVTPAPRAHALFADKRNLVLLSDPVAMAQIGLAAEDLAALGAVPSTVRLTAADAEALWADRKSYFFKPFGGHAGKAVYRGDKITTTVWEHIVSEGRHVAQRSVQPSHRNVLVDTVAMDRKADIRLYTHGGDVLLAAARIYQGQTTNFRTIGGGFAPVIVL
jgi:hypothetical protein